MPSPLLNTGHDLIDGFAQAPPRIVCVAQQLQDLGLRTITAHDAHAVKHGAIDRKTTGRGGAWGIKAPASNLMGPLGVFMAKRRYFQRALWMKSGEG